MDYNILETHLIFENNVLKSVAVLCENYGDVFVTICTDRPKGGYYYLKSYDIPTMTLFIKVAGFGRKLLEQERKKYFPNYEG